MKKWILKAEGISKSYYTPTKISILSGVDLSVEPGETVAIMGRSGQGKSTLLHLLGTLEKPCAGYLEIAGQKISVFNKSRVRNRHIGFIFQSFHLLEDYTSLENVLWPARIARENTAKGSPHYNHALSLLEEVGLKDRAHFHTKLLSGGEKQRIAIARALCNDPDIIFADEPSGNLDQQTSEIIHNLLLGFVKKGNKTLIVVTHNQDLTTLCDRTYNLHAGQLTIRPLV
jgi:lipoprotein-releasing system ATP-binding protein